MALLVPLPYQREIQDPKMEVLYHIRPLTLLVPEMAIDLSIESIQWGLKWSSTFDGIQTPDPQSCCAKQLPKSKLSLTVL